MHLVSRATAAKQLRDLLLAGSAAADEPTLSPGWAITTVPTINFDPETKIEQKFRAVLRERLQVLGVTVQAKPQTPGERWDITAGGGREWTLEPQVLVAGSKPDFLLRCNDPSIPNVAIFCDGAFYHASPQHNRLADDAVKRRLLREQGMVVLAFSWADLEEEPPTDPPWLDATAAPHLMAHSDFDLRPRTSN